jgi:hypothetical protein
MRYDKVTTIFLAAMFVASLATARWGGPGASEPSIDRAGHSIVLAGIASDVWRERYTARAAVEPKSVGTPSSASSAFERRIARPARPEAPAAITAAPETFKSGAFAGGCGARRAAAAERPWCEAKADN